jgi:hypothetical protein
MTPLSDAIDAGRVPGFESIPPLFDDLVRLYAKALCGTPKPELRLSVEFLADFNHQCPA